MSNYQELYQQANQLPHLEKLRLAELLLANLDTPDPDSTGSHALRGNRVRTRQRPVS